MTRYATEYGAFCIEQIPNQPQLAHCHSFHIKDEFKGMVVMVRNSGVRARHGYLLLWDGQRGDGQHAEL